MLTPLWPDDLLPGGQVVVDQLRTVDKARLTKRLGTLDPCEAAAVLDVLREFFAP
jgi:mRNA interferase MazF